MSTRKKWPDPLPYLTESSDMKEGARRLRVLEHLIGVMQNSLDSIQRLEMAEELGNQVDAIVENAVAEFRSFNAGDVP